MMLKKSFRVRRPILSTLTSFSLLFAVSPGIALGEDPWSRNTLDTPRQATIATPVGTTIFAEIADTPARRAHGLMFRSILPPDHGMLFLFSKPGFWTFWMKNTHISLDIVWLDQEGRVVHLESRVPICTRKDEGCPRYRPHKQATYVLEIPAGMAERYHIAPGTRLSIVFPPEQTQPLF